MKKDTNTSEKSKILMRTYITGLLSLMLCVTMLLGTTYAWFTSEVTTGGNEIAVGTLKVDMVNAAGNSLKNATGLFGSGTFKWEPGATQIETVKVVNQGDLAFDYGLYFSTLSTNVGALATVGKHIDVYVTTQNAPANSAEDIKNNWIRVGTLADTARNGYMLSNGSWKPGDADALDTVKIALHMPAEVTDTTIMGAKIQNLGIKLMATQKVYELDAFEGKYDEAAPVDVLVSTYQELAAAVSAGQSMRLTESITAPENVTLTVATGKTVFIDMNGYDITATSSGKGANRELFLVKGSLIIKGKGDDSVITYSHKAEDNMEWNNMSTIFDITAGGVVQLLDVKAVNAGGTDMNFVAHLNNWGAASLYLDGAKLEAPYCAIRVNNSGFDMNNVVAKDSVISADNRALWVHNYHGDLDPAKHTPEAIDARLNISILDPTNTIKGDLRYGFNKTELRVVDGDAFNRAMTKEPAKIVLLKDISINDNMHTVAAGTFTLDLNGHDMNITLNANGSHGTARHFFTVKNGATMNVVGDGDVTLTTTVTDNTNVSVAIFRNEGNLNLDGGNYKIVDNSQKVEGAMIITTIVDTCLGSGEAITTINGGSYTLTGSSINLFRNLPTSASATCRLVINDGTFHKNTEKTTYIWNQQLNANHKSYMTFNGGTYDGILCEDYLGNDDIQIATGITGLTIYNGN